MPVTAPVPAAGGKIVCQLWHVGRLPHVSLQENGAAPVVLDQRTIIHAGIQKICLVRVRFAERRFREPGM